MPLQHVTPTHAFLSTDSDCTFDTAVLDAADEHEVPDGEWFCWGCARNLDYPFLHPTTPVSAAAMQWSVNVKRFSGLVAHHLSPAACFYE